MEATTLPFFRDQLLDRRQKLETAAATLGRADEVTRLLREVDAALGRFDGWDVAYHYQPAGPVSGDYCDLIPGNADHFYFLIGDVAGKGVAIRRA